MATAPLWVKVTLSVAGTPMNALVSNALMDPAYRDIILAGSDASPLFGYAPGSGNAGFRLRTVLMPANAADVVNAALNQDGVPVAIQYADAGGASVALAFLYDSTISVSGQGELEWNAQFATVSVPDPTGTAGTTSARGLPWRINDLTSVSLPGGSTPVKLSAVSFRIQRPLSEFRGNSPFGLPQDLGLPYTKVMSDATYQKTAGVIAEMTAATKLPRKIADSTILFTQVDATSPATLKLTCKNAFHSKLPETSGNTTDFVVETASLMSETGEFDIV